MAEIHMGFGTSYTVWEIYDKVKPKVQAVLIYIAHVMVLIHSVSVSYLLDCVLIIKYILK